MQVNGTSLEIFDTKPESVIVTSFVLGIALTLISMITIWLIIGHIFVRFPQYFKNKRTLRISVITCLFLAFINGFVRWILLTNIFLDTENILLFSPFQCKGIFWEQIFTLQLNQYLFYIYLLSRIKSLKVLSNGVYYFLLLIISFIMLFTTIALPFYSIPTIFESEDIGSDIILCGAGSLRDAEVFEEYAVFLSLNAAIYCVLLFVFVYKFTLKAYSLLSKRILLLGMIAVVFNLSEFVVFILSETTIHAIRMILYCLLILVSFDILAKNQERGDINCCCWCTIDDQQKPELVGDIDDDESTDSPMIMHSDDPSGLQPKLPKIPNTSTGLLAN